MEGAPTTHPSILVESWLLDLILSIHLLIYSRCLELMLCCHFLFLVLIGFSSFFYSATSIPSGTSSLMVSISCQHLQSFWPCEEVFPHLCWWNFVDSRWSLWFPRFHCCLVCVWTDGPQFWGTAVLACYVKWHPSFVCFIVIFLLSLHSFPLLSAGFCCCCCWEWGWKRELWGVGRRKIFTPALYFSYDIWNLSKSRQLDTWKMLVLYTLEA